MSNELTGKIKVIMEPKTFSSGFMVRGFVEKCGPKNTLSMLKSLVQK